MKRLKAYKINVSIGAIINKIKGVLLACEGDIISMVNVVKNLNIEGMFNFAKTFDRNRVVKTSTDIDGVNVYILFDYTQEISNSQCSLKKYLDYLKRKFR